MLGSNLDIMSSQWTDVIFKDRNQAYGAYQLRKENSHTTAKALLIATSMFVFALATPTIINMIRGYIPAADVAKTIEIPYIQSQIVVIPEKPPVVQQKQIKPHNDVLKYVPPVVVPDDKAQTDPPTNTKVMQNDVGHDNLKGDHSSGPAEIDVPLVDKPTEGINTSNATPSDKPFIVAENNPEYPGGEAAFAKFLQNHIRYPNIAKENGVQGRVFVQFVVERDGSLTDLQIVRNPGSGLGEEAVRVLRISPHWKPGSQNGKLVRVQYTVPVNFALAE